MDFFSINHLLVHIPIGRGGYNLSWIEATGTLCGLLCIWLASKEKVINYLFGLINVTLFALIFFQIQLYSSLLLQIFFFLANIYGWYAWTRHASGSDPSLSIRWMSRRQTLVWLVVVVIAIGLLTCFIDPVFGALSATMVKLLQLAGFSVSVPLLQPDAYPFWDACMTVLSVVAMVLMTRKYVENWLLWVVINLISIGIFALQGVYAMSLEYVVLTFIALNGCRLWIASAREHHSRALSRHQ